MTYLLAYISTAIVFLAIDFVWLSQIAPRFYFGHLGHLLLEKPNLLAAAGFYLVYVVGLVIFAVAPALKAESITTALLFGALFGFFTYATYDMTNYATLKGWPFVVVAVDIVWGTLLSAVAAWSGYMITRQFIG